MKLFKLQLLLLIFISASSTAQNTIRSFKSLKEHPNLIEVRTNDGAYFMKLLSENSIETSFVPEGEKLDLNSHCVISSKEIIEVKLSEDKLEVRYETKGIRVRIQKRPFQINYFYKEKQIISEAEGFYSKDSLEVLKFKIDSQESLYGTGARVLGMNRRGHRLELYNKAHYGYETHSELMNFTIPMVLSSNKYAIHFDNPQVGFIDLDSEKNNTLKYEVIGGRKTYQIIVGDSWKQILNSYTQLTGRQPLPPRWAFGNFASRFGYHSEKEATEVVNKFREEEIPLDAIIFDLYWFGKGMTGTMGNLEFLKNSFPSPKKMIKSFKDVGVKTILITEPFILKKSKKWKETVDENLLATTKTGEPFVYDFYFGTTGLLDVFKPKTKKWFWNIYKEYNNLGVEGWWGDLGEPEVHPKDLQHVNGSANEVHNIYGHNWAKLLSEGYKKDYPNKRPFILMRAGYSGSQRFGMIPWSGDVNRTWGGLQAQMEISLQMGMQGLAYMHSDLGGFAGANDDTELYTRWLQYGVFQPIYRPHAQEEVASEPVFKDANTKALTKKAIELRYQLLPYNYSLAFENNQTGMPLMRALMFEENSEISDTISSTYLWGNEFLIHPIVHKAQKNANVYFPKKNNWFDFYTGEKHKGGRFEIVDVENEFIPTFIRGGAFIPMIETIQTTDSYSLKHLKLHFYYDSEVEKSKGILYHDDGKTKNAFEKEHFEILNFQSKIKDDKISISIKSVIGKSYIEEEKEIECILHNVLKKPKKIIVNNKKIDFNWADKTLTMKVKYLQKINLKICL
jgi:alpha-glucosidase (family GH31 glycosyl hydrolase)